MDGRNIIHGQERVLQQYYTMLGSPSWQTDPELLAAKLVIVPADSALYSILLLSPRFELAHKDSIAAVFVPK
jgi:hypothetical protein